ncbi:MAG: hypothetical protein OES09_05245, partial [Gammaproteobacteria bacterium]|nr:hypothetical protein [Gammaproteobacteria bacterium]
WTEQAILELDQSRVRRVEVTHPDGEVVAVKRETPTDKDLSLVGLREDETIESAYGVNNIARSLAELTLDDVQPADGIDFDTDATRAVLETFDGLRISLLIKEHEEKKYGRLHAEFDPELRNAANAQDAEPDEAVKPVENFEQQAVEYNRLWAGRAYVLPAHQYSGIAVRRKDLVTQAGDGEPKNEKS